MKKRWDFTPMFQAGQKLFERIRRKKRMASANHDVHLLARTINEWLPQGIQSLIEGTYTPRFLKRYYFKDEMLDQLYLADRVLQNLLLQQLKPTFPYVMNPNCYHVHGPSGVQLAAQRIRETLATKHYKYIIRADIKSYYKSIQHHVLIEDIKRYYFDTKVQLMLEQIVRNPIETPRGYKNPDNGIALRGPLSQFFSALYLKPLDDAFDTLDVTYLRYQDDIIILCHSKRQLERCKRRLMTILKERHLQLSRKKTRIGAIEGGFHFLGINYLEPQSPGSTNVTQDIREMAVNAPLTDDSCLLFNQTGGGGVNK
ncbi:reverse transcriptase domain-containing protein, partial [Legionella pneumophila serogroup 1]